MGRIKRRTKEYGKYWLNIALFTSVTSRGNVCVLITVFQQKSAMFMRWQMLIKVNLVES